MILTYIRIENLLLKCYNIQYSKKGIRTGKIINNKETKYYLEGTNIVFETKDNNILYFMRDNTNDLIGFKYNDNIYYYIKNAQNDIIGILDSNYNIVAKYKYNSWGVNIKITDGIGNDVQNNLNHIANINPFRYRSYYYDTETKLYYLNSRYYNPLWGRFLNMDSYGGELGGNPLMHNLFAYTLNNPIVNTDKSGNLLELALPKIVEGTLKVIAAVVGAYAATKTVEILAPKAISAARNLKKHTLTIDEPKRDAIKVQEDTKVDTVVPYAPTIDEYKPCTVAWRTKYDVMRGERLSIEESISYVNSWGDIMCDNQLYAKLVASEWDDSYHHSAHRGGAAGYYPHYHPWDGYNHPHIWYLP